MSKNWKQVKESLRKKADAMKAKEAANEDKKSANDADRDSVLIAPNTSPMPSTSSGHGGIDRAACLREAVHGHRPDDDKSHEPKSQKIKELAAQIDAKKEVVRKCDREKSQKEAQPEAAPVRVSSPSSSEESSSASSSLECLQFLVKMKESRARPCILF
jgi:hypothetical protein